MQDVYKEFKACFAKESKKICQTSRFHYTDMRYMFVTGPQKYGNYILSNLSNNPIITTKIKDAINAYFHYLLDKDSIINKRIQKQIDNVEDPKVKKTLEDYWHECKKTHYLTFLFKEDVGKKLWTVINAGKLSRYKVCLMDLYLMARCFRTYKKGSKYSRPSYNNIIYAGGAHVHNYINILLKLGFVIDFKSANFDTTPEKMKETSNKGIEMGGFENVLRTIPNFQCLDVSEMKQPMFYQRYTDY
jgi:hypothetical protein